MIGRSRRVSSLPPPSSHCQRAVSAHPALGMEDETSDILGQQTKPVLRANKNDNWFTISLAVRVAFAGGILLVLYVVIMRIWFRILVWKERSYKLCVSLFFNIALFPGIYPLFFLTTAR